MLLHISSNSEYLEFLHSEKDMLSFSDRNRLEKNEKLRNALWRFRKFDPGLVEDVILPLYSQTGGRPAFDPAITLRSFLLMTRLGFTSIDNWVNELQADPVLQYIIGSWSVPAVATHYDFINRIMQVDPHLDTLLPANKHGKEVKELLKALRLKKNEKWVNFDDGDTRSLKERYWEDASCDSERSSYVIEKMFNDLVVNPSSVRGLIPAEGLILSGDGSALHIHANPFGHKVKDADDDDDFTHRYTAPDADIGWDSDLGTHYFGYTFYNISYHNPGIGVDLPVFLTMKTASQHDALTTISATAQFLDMNPGLHPTHACFDSASDSYHIYEYLRHKDIIPVIDWNKRTSDKKSPYAEYEGINERGFPVCRCGEEMVRDGYDNSKKATKFRCPLKKGRIDSCPCADQCSPSPYGRVVKIYDKTNYKLFGPIPYRSDEWKEIFKNRTSTERINNRVLNDYGLHSLTCRCGDKLRFFAAIAGMNIHMDAWCKAELLS